MSPVTWLTEWVTRRGNSDHTCFGFRSNSTRGQAISSTAATEIATLQAYFDASPDGKITSLPDAAVEIALPDRYRPVGNSPLNPVWVSCPCRGIALPEFPVTGSVSPVAMVEVQPKQFQPQLLKYLSSPQRKANIQSYQPPQVKPFVQIWSGDIYQINREMPISNKL